MQWGALTESDFETACTVTAESKIITRFCGRDVIGKHHDNPHDSCVVCNPCIGCSRTDTGILAARNALLDNSYSSVNAFKTAISTFVHMREVWCAQKQFEALSRHIWFLRELHDNYGHLFGDVSVASADEILSHDLRIKSTDVYNGFALQGFYEEGYVCHIVYFIPPEKTEDYFISRASRVFLFQKEEHRLYTIQTIRKHDQFWNCVYIS